MKYLLILAVILIVLWLWRGSRRSPSQDQSAPRQAATPQQDMVQCPVCLVHLPRSDALPGPNGQLYCCAEHRSRAES